MLPALKLMTFAILALTASACSSLGASGPSGSAVKNAERLNYANNAVQVIDLNEQVITHLAAFHQSGTFAQVFGDSPKGAGVIGNGDTIDIAIWEAPPAVLFGATGGASQLATNLQVTQSANIPQQMVGDEGTVTVPFAGVLRVTGRTTAQIEAEIVDRLRGKAHDPQVIVRLIENQTRNVTVIGEVENSLRVPLSARGERVLDVLASAGGASEPVDKTTVQIVRGNETATMPLEQIILNPVQNIPLLPDDVISVLYQPYSFTAMGALTRNAEVPFEGGGLSLAQALGRLGGLREDRADIRGVFVFRLEDATALDPVLATNARTTAAGRVPVIYRLDLSDPTSIFAAQDFAIRDDDVLYVSTAPGSDIQRFIATLSNVAFSTIAIGNAIR